MVCDGLTSRFEVASELVKLLNLQNKINIVKVKSNYFADEYFAVRPDCERLINKRLNYLTLNIMPNWKVSLRDY